GIANNPEFDRHKILITVHDKNHRAWFWLIPFADGRSSFGVVAEQDFFNDYLTGNAEQDQNEVLLKRILADDTSLSKILAQAKFDTPVRTLVGYSA
ncbi:FAD-dependent oxidoreductase, partial [bacterium LRH843]|nr:FAD-dependent oxidoreductase [bacterium LRH843]